MRWNMRMKAAELGIWKSSELRRRFAAAGLEISASKMYGLWTGNPTTIRLEDLEVICAVLDCEPSDLLIREPEKLEALRPARTGSDDQPEASEASARVRPRLNRDRPAPPV